MLEHHEGTIRKPTFYLSKLGANFDDICFCQYGSRAAVISSLNKEINENNFYANLLFTVGMGLFFVGKTTGIVKPTDSKLVSQ